MLPCRNSKRRKHVFFSGYALYKMSWIKIGQLAKIFWEIDSKLPLEKNCPYGCDRTCLDFSIKYVTFLDIVKFISGLSSVWKDLQRTGLFWSSVLRRRTTPRPPIVKAWASPSLPNHFFHWIARYHGSRRRQTSRYTLETRGAKKWRERWDTVISKLRKWYDPLMFSLGGAVASWLVRLTPDRQVRV